MVTRKQPVARGPRNVSQAMHLVPGQVALMEPSP